MPIPVLAFLPCGSVPVWARFITGTGMLLCLYRYWHCCTLVQYQYGHSPLPILEFNCAHNGISMSAFWFSTSMGTVHYQCWHSIMVPVLVLALLHLGSVPVLAHSITGTGIQKWCPYRYWHFCTFVQYQYGHSPVLVLAFYNCARTGIGISALWFNTGMDTVNYWYWHSEIVPIPVLTFLYFGSVPVWAHSITGTGIQKWFQYRYWHFCTLVQYQFWHGSLLILALDNGTHTGTGILALWFSTGICTFHYWYWHLKMVPVPVLAFLHFGSVPVWAHSITGTGIQTWFQYRY